MVMAGSWVLQFFQLLPWYGKVAFSFGTFIVIFALLSLAAKGIALLNNKFRGRGKVSLQQNLLLPSTNEERRLAAVLRTLISEDEGDSHSGYFVVKEGVNWDGVTTSQYGSLYIDFVWKVYVGSLYRHVLSKQPTGLVKFRPPNKSEPGVIRQAPRLGEMGPRGLDIKWRKSGNLVLRLFLPTEIISDINGAYGRREKVVFIFDDVLFPVEAYDPDSGEAQDRKLKVPSEWEVEIPKAASLQLKARLRNQDFVP